MTPKLDPTTHPDHADYILANAPDADYEAFAKSAEERREYEEYLDGLYTQRELEKINGGTF